MIKLNKLNYNTRKRLVKYLSHVSRPMQACIQRVIKELVYGLIASSSSCISEIARTLNETVPMMARIKRITRNLVRYAWHTELEDSHLTDVADQVTSNSVIVIDGSDIIKPRAVAMEHMAVVHDGSKNELGLGYPYLTVAIVNQHRNEVIPVTNRLFSRREESYISDNDEFERLSEKMFEHLGNQGIYVLDRGFCSENRMKFLGNQGFSFVLRSQKRSVCVDGREVNLFDWANDLALPYSVTIERIRNGEMKREIAWYCVRDISIAGDPYRAVIMQIEGHGIAVLLTNIAIGVMKHATFGEKIIHLYGFRWSIEEMIRFQKDVFDIEDVRVRSMTALKNFMMVVMIATSFLSHFLSSHVKITPLVKNIISVGNSLRHEVRFLYYQLALGLRELWKKCRMRVFVFHRRHKRESVPLPLFDESTWA